MKDRIKKIRIHFDLTQQEFADRIGIKRGAVANYEIGRNEPTDSVLSLICREYDVNEKWLRTGEGEMFIQKSKEDQIMEWAGSVLKEESTTFRSRFVAMLSKLSPEDWEVLERMAASLVENKETPDDQS